MPAYRLSTCCGHGIVAAGLAVAFSAAAAQTRDSYPVRPIRLVVAYSPGGGNDTVARLIAPHLTSAFGQQVIIDNRAGAGGTLGAALVARAEADGYTLLVSSLGTHAVAPNLFKKPGYDPVKDFEAVTLLANTPIVLVVNKTLPEVDSVKALVALAKAKPNSIRYASGGFGAPPHTAAAVFETMAGIKMQHVPYKGGGPAIVGLHAGETNIMFGPAATMLAQAKSGRVKALAISRPTRLPTYADVPTFAEAGFPGYAANAWFGIHAPARTPKAIITVWNRELLRVIRLPELQDRFKDADLEIMGTTADDFDKFVRKELAKYAVVVKQSGMEAN